MPVSYAVEANTHCPILYEVYMSRRKGRYERRNQAREAKKEHLKKYDDFNNFSSISSLFKAGLNAMRGVFWKDSSQRFYLGMLFRTTKQHKKLQSGKKVQQGFITFYISERGKTRKIDSVHIDERIIQKSLCNNAMIPILYNSVIYDNSASQKNKGTHFAIARIKKFLHRYYREYGNIGYVLNIDFKKYFESIPHEVLKKIFREKFKDERLIKTLDDFVDAFGERGLGLGSETSQINAVVHINEIDHYIKEQARIKGYNRYMDDSIIIHPDKDFLQKLFGVLKEYYAKFGVTINTKKTHICDLKHGFKYLQTRIFMTDTGKIILKPCRESITRERRKLKKQAKKFYSGDMTLEEIEQSYQSWRGAMKHRNANRTVYSMDMLYRKLFKGGSNNGNDTGRKTI